MTLSRAWFVVFVVASLLTVGSCATTKFKSTWSSPDANAVTLAGKKVVALVAFETESVRRDAERALSVELSKLGAVPIASHTILPGTTYRDRELAKEKILASGADGAVVMRLVAIDQQITYGAGALYTPGMWADPFYDDFWGYYGWGVTVVSMPTIRTDNLVSIETTAYSIAQGKLIWGGLSETMNPVRVDQMVGEVARAAAGRMERAGLLKKARS